MFRLDYVGGPTYASRPAGFLSPTIFSAPSSEPRWPARTGLKVGSEFRPTHGAGGQDGHEHDPFTVVGVLKPTGTPNDRALFINIEGFYLLDNHAKPLDDEPGASLATAKPVAASPGITTCRRRA